MINNAQKKKEIGDVLAKYTAKMSALKQRRDSIVSGFLKILKERRIDEIRQSIK